MTPPDAAATSRGARSHRRLHAVATLLAVAILPTLAWALWPSRDPDIPHVRAAEAADIPAATLVSFDADAFSTPIWVAPPPPPKPPELERTLPPPPPPEPLKVQLLSIVRDGDTRRAMLFDPDTKKILTLVVGDHVGPMSGSRTITSITDKDVVITGSPPNASQTLSLRDPASSPPPTAPTGKPRRRP